MSRRASLMTVVALTLFIGACTIVGPNHQRPDTPLPAQFEADAGAGGARVPADWWRAFGDPQLDALVADAMERSPDARQLLAQIDEAEAALREATERFEAMRSASSDRVSALEMLTALVQDLQRQGIELHLTDVKGPVMDRLEMIGFVDLLGRQRIHLSAHEAMKALGCVT